jgi:hypothetical protein
MCFLDMYDMIQDGLSWVFLLSEAFAIRITDDIRGPTDSPKSIAINSERTSLSFPQAVLEFNYTITGKTAFPCHPTSSLVQALKIHNFTLRLYEQGRRKWLA